MVALDGRALRRRGPGDRRVDPASTSCPGPPRLAVEIRGMPRRRRGRRRGRGAGREARTDPRVSGRRTCRRVAATMRGYQSFRHQTPHWMIGIVFTCNDLRFAVADGATTISDVAVLADQAALFGAVASDSTCWRLLDRLDTAGLGAVALARARARAVAWA